MPVSPSIRRVASSLLLPLGLVLGFTGRGWFLSAPIENAAPEPEPEDHSSVRFARARWSAAGIHTEPVAAAPLSDHAWRTGRIVVNDDRVAHVSPPVEGIIREVRARLGQNVTTGQILAVLDSKEASQAKLELVTARTALAAEREREAWARQTATNTEALVQAVAAGKRVAEIDSAFKNRPVGERRHQLMAVYTSRSQLKAQLDSERASAGAVAEMIRRKTEADFDAADASLQSLLEESKFQSRQHARLAELKLKEAEAAFDVVRTRLLTLGYAPAEIDAMDPVKEGRAVSNFEVRAPFSGTIVDKHAVLSERVNAQFQMFQLADLNEVWVQADAFEADLPLLRGLGDRKLVFRAPGAGISDRSATVFYSGDLFDRASRAITVTATAPNPERMLKPGMYVEVGLPRGNAEPVIQVPVSAVQQHQGKSFVFVLVGEDEFRRADVETGREAGERVEIRAGLKPGDVVAVGGVFVLKSELFRDQLAGE